MKPPRTPGWREPIFNEFSSAVADVACLTIVADPDGLLAESGVVEGLRERGFEILAFIDHVAFRYAYERSCRRFWDDGVETSPIIVLRLPVADVSSLPYDLLEGARKAKRLLSFSLGELFPHLAPRVVGELDRSVLDRLFIAQQELHPGPLGETATRDFLLRHVFELDPSSAPDDEGLLHLLLRRHSTRRTVPPSLEDRIVEILGERFGTIWPLDQLVRSRARFLKFIQERWPLFLKRTLITVSAKVGEAPRVPLFDVPGPDHLPFGADTVRVYIDTLFLDGHLTPSAAVPRSAVIGTWMEAGVAGNEEADHSQRMEGILDIVERDLPAEDSSHQDWLLAAQRWAELTMLRWASTAMLDVSRIARIESVRGQLAGAFAAWLPGHYPALANLSFLPRPVMLHQIPRDMAHGFGGQASARKRALVVVDGLALDQWAVLRHEMPASGWLIDESALFAWVPTLTSVARQSIFAGEPPFYFASSIGHTQKEAAHWTRFWLDEGVRRSEVVYLCWKKQDDDEALVHRVREAVENPKCRVLAAVIGTVDQMLHGTVTGTGGLHASIRHWAKNGSLWRLLRVLTDGGFEVFLTADHGNVEARGIGHPNVGLTAEQRGARVHIFRDEPTRQAVGTDYLGTTPWPAIGLPADYLPLIAPPDGAFIAKGERTVTHGGACLEELIVPFIQFSKRV